MIAKADVIVADQASGEVWHLEAPHQVHDGNTARRHLGLPEVDVDDFFSLHFKRSDLKEKPQ